MKIKSKGVLALLFSSIFILNSCKKEEAEPEKQTATFEVNCDKAYSIIYAYEITGQGGHSVTEKGIGFKSKTIEINIEKGKELQLFVITDDGLTSYIETAIKVDGVEKVRKNLICSAGHNFIVYKFE